MVNVVYPPVIKSGWIENPLQMEDLTGKSPVLLDDFPLPRLMIRGQCIHYFPTMWGPPVISWFMFTP
jgi:hypothetical protein